jgi:hypothetical protein
MILSVYPAIGDAIDEDGSGYISVHEANRFFSKKPKNWTTPEWLALCVHRLNYNILSPKVFLRVA